MRLYLTRASLFTAALTLTAAPSIRAQDAKPRTTPPNETRVLRPLLDTPLIWQSSKDRAVLGVTLGASTRSDTAGVRIDDVDADGPAAKAGIKAGDIITEINGVSLRVSSADAEDLALAGVAQRRLQRTMAKAKPGDEVDLRVRTGTVARSVKIKTTSAAELAGPSKAGTSSIVRESGESHGAIGLSIGSSGSVRDTLGLFISSVVAGGPAEKAGVVEGERIAAVNGVDVRIPKEDVDDGSVSSARVNRFVREVQKVAPGANLTLRVFGNGRFREVTVPVVKSADLPNQGQLFEMGDNAFRILRGGDGPSIVFERGSAAGGAAPRAQGRMRINGEDFDFNQFDSTAMREAMERLRSRLQGMRIQSPTVRIKAGLTRM